VNIRRIWLGFLGEGGVMKLRHVFALFVLILGLAVGAYSQAVSSLRGTVADSSGAVVPGANVVLSNQERGLQESRVTDADGNYVFSQVPPGTYDLKVSASQFAPYESRVTLLVQQPANLNIKLKISAASEIVEVIVQVPALNTTDASIGAAVDNATISELPMEGRNVPDLLSLQPGVLYLGRQVDPVADSRSGSVSGARSDQNNLTLDGVDNNDQLQGLAFTGVLRSTLDSVQEFRVTTVGANADSGRSSGGQVTLVTKSGTDTFHGSLYEFNRNTFFAANDWFNKTSQLSAGLPNKPGKLIRNTFGASLGGPIKKDKAFFFLNYEGQRTRENQQLVQFVPSSTMRQGIVKYFCNSSIVNGQKVDPNCVPGGVPGSKVAPAPFPGVDPTKQLLVTLQPSDLLNIDHNCASNPVNSTTFCPWGGGVDPNVLPVLQSYPLPNLAGSGDGQNIEEFTFSAPRPTSLNTYIAKFDLQLSPSNQLFARGTLLSDRQSGTPQFPGQPASSVTTNTSKGFVLGDTWTFSPRLVNNLRYGYIRQGIGVGGIGGNHSYVSFGAFPFTPGLANPVAETRTTLTNVPVHNLVDDLTWVKGKHTLEFGGNYRHVVVNNATDAISFNSAATGANNYVTGGLSGTGQSLDPGFFASQGYPAVIPTFGGSYDVAATAVDGVVDAVGNIHNYRVAAGKNSSTLLPTGAVIPRAFRDNEYEWYVQDSWRVKPNLTITLGLRHTLLQPPSETNGQQISPTTSLADWFSARGAGAAKGLSVEPQLSLAPSGPANGGPTFWTMNKLNFAPRVAVAYSPSFDNGVLHHLFGKDKTSLRAGFGLDYDHFGQGIAQALAQNGSLGLSTTIAAPSIFTTDTSSRFTGLTNIPNIFTPPLATQNYPFVPTTNTAQGGFASSFGVDDKMKTPYSMTPSLSVQRELPGGVTLEAAYVGRFGRHLLQQLDTANWVDLVDPKSGMDFFNAAALMGKAVQAGATTIAPIPYWENLWPLAAGNGNTATQNIFSLFAANPQTPFTVMLILDAFCPAGNPSNVCGGQPGRYFSLQFGDLFSWFSTGTSSYNAGQFSLRRKMSRGLQMDATYTYSKSIDLGSDAERNAITAFSANGSVFNPWRPKWNRGVSDFDTTHIVNGDWIYELPFGRGKALGAHANRAVNAVFGGWKLAGLWRWTSGLPFSINSPGFPSSFIYHSFMVQTARIQTSTHFLNGQPQVFADPQGLLNGVSAGNPWRLPYAGEVGNRNNLRGDGYFGIDTALSKTFTIREGHSLKFAWEVFNATNSLRFDVRSLLNVEGEGGFGGYQSLLTAPRVQQFSLRYQF
jgi:hypothetical protein